MTLPSGLLLTAMLCAVGLAVGEEPARVLPTESVPTWELEKLRVTLTFSSVVTAGRYLKADLRIDNVGEVNVEVPTNLQPNDAVRIDWTDEGGKRDRAYAAHDTRPGGALAVLSPGSYLGSRILLGRSGWPCGQSDTSGCYWPAGRYEFTVTLETPSNIKLGIGSMTFKSDPVVAHVTSR